MSKAIAKAKKERIDKQYYVTSEQDFALTKEIAEDMYITVEDFLIKMKMFINSLSTAEIEKARSKFIKLLNSI